MVTLDKIRVDLEKKLTIDKDIHFVEILGDTLDECLADAAVQLDSKVKNLEYEVLEKGYAGIIGLMKKPWKIRVYENPTVVQRKKKIESSQQTDSSEDVVEVERLDRDGAFFIHRFGSKVCVKVLLPIGSGRPIDEKDLIASARRPDNTELDEDLLAKLAKTGTEEEYIEVGSYNHIQAADALLAIDITKDEMQATATISPASPGGADISFEQVVNALRVQGVVAGIEDDKINDLVDQQTANVAVEVAAAVQPIHGNDAYIEYKVETNRSKVKLKETASGQVDFKELNLIENVVAGQPLAIKILPQRGKVGKTIMGRLLEARNGKDIPFPIGANVKIDADGRTIVAEKSGHVMLVGDKITVEEVYEVQGVNFKTGNISYMGTVVCRGNVEDGFSIKASGNIEIYGSVGNCRLEAEGDIVISQGVMGRDEGEIISNKSVWARFLQNVKVYAGEYIVVNDNIMNSHVTAMKKILLKGKKAAIIGGHLFATEEITAKSIGSSGGSFTTLEVGFDPKAKQRLSELQEMQSNLMKELEEIDLNISTLENNKKVRKVLPKEKEESLAKYKDQRADIMDQCEEMTGEINQIQERLRELKAVGCVNCSGTVFAGTKILVRDEIDEVKSECKAVTFYYDGGFVKRGKYDPSQVTEDVGAPDGFTTN